MLALLHSNIQLPLSSDILLLSLILSETYQKIMNRGSLSEQVNTRRRNRATRPNRIDDGAESDDSMPSLQTVSDSSEAENFDSDEEEEESDDDDLPPLASVDDAAPSWRNMPFPAVEEQEESDSEPEASGPRLFGALPSVYTTPLSRGETRATQVCSPVTLYHITPVYRSVLRHLMNA